MKFSEKWLREWIDPKVNSIALKDQIIYSGIEVESINKFEPIFCGVLVGKIVQCIVHSKLKKLKVVKVDIGKKQFLNIVCGAPNCRNGIKVAVATIGSILPSKIKINVKNLQGELSEGMLCSFFELGLFYTTNIIEFDEEVLIGDNVSNYLSLKDNIIKVNVTSNRPDGLSILGISRNIAAMNNLKLLPLKNKLILPEINDRLLIDIQAKKECINFLGRIIKDVNVNVETPFWIKKKLFFSDILSENVITDIINYVLIEIGQPLNILNADNIDDLIIVRMAEPKESIILKNNIKIYLNKNILVFSDKHQILSIPGNINSYMLDIDQDTKNIFLSSSLINEKTIFYIIKTMNLNNSLEYYRHGIDSSLQSYAIEYATDLIIKICGGSPGPISKQENNSSLYINNVIRLNHTNLNKKSGIFIEAYVVSNILHNLNYQVIFQTKYWDVIPPSFRFDILVEEDVISDILRIYGYNNICLTPLKENLNSSQKTELIDLLLYKSATILINKGYYEIITYGFVDPEKQSIIFPNKEKLLILNPISKDLSSMRSSLWTGLINAVVYNKNYKQESIRFFESGLCFSVDKTKNLGVKQEILLGGVISGNFFQQNWYSKIRKVDFYDLKGDLECILESICDLESIEFRRQIISGLHPEQSASIYFKDNFIGSIGAIDPRLEKLLNLNSSTFLFEISLNNFLDIKSSKVQKISKFPISRRDISVVISDKILFSDVISECKKIFINKKVEINLFDVYSCKEFSNRKKSLGISLTFQDENQTLKEDEINLMVNNCIGALKKKFQVILRK